MVFISVNWIECKMRVVTYNILNGGEGRADPLAEVLLAQRPDIVALVEADVSAVVERIAKRLSMDFIIGQGKHHAAALLSRWPIQQTINHAAFSAGISRSFLEASVLAPGGNEWPIGVLHLPAGATDADEDSRIRDLAVMLDLFKDHRFANRPHILCGDFNSNAPYQRIDPSRCKITTQQAWKSNGNQLPRRVIEAMLAVGYVDTYRALHDEQSELTGSLDTQHPGQRVDYIFTFGVPVANVSGSWVEQDRLAKYASDHFPVGAEISE
jgi:endonuclease/exonuclease/phosphatase family metal-dependent hydrolase